MQQQDNENTASGMTNGSTPILSIIVPVYKVEKYLRQCIDSLLSQPGNDIEIVLVDDGSPDNCPAICDEYAASDSRISVLHKANGGVSTARNAGMDAARGTWITFVDSDDFVYPEYVSTIRKHLNSDIDLLFFGLRFKYNDGSTFDEVFGDFLVHDSNELPKRILSVAGSGFTHSKVFCRKMIFEHNIRFKDGLHMHEDKIFFLEYCNHITSMRCISNVLYEYRCGRPGGATSIHHSSHEIQMLGECYCELSKMYDYKPMKDYLLESAGSWLALSVIGTRGIGNIIRQWRHVNAYCHREGIRHQYRHVIVPVIRTKLKKIFKRGK